MTEATSFVRLECVMHAASVNPEPGSNSLKNYILSKGRPSVNTFSRVYLAFVFTFLSIFVLSKCY